MIAFLGLPGGSEWIIVLLIALLLFGSRLPSVARSLAQALAGFKHEMNKAREDLAAEIDEVDKLDAPKPQQPKQAEKQGQEQEQGQNQNQA